jgi:hypothetical protein
MRAATACLALIAAALGGWPLGAAADDPAPPAEITIPLDAAPRQLALSAGGAVTLLGMAPLVARDGWTGLVLIYRTALPLDDAPALRGEVDQVWQRMRPEIVRSRADQVVIVARAAAAPDGTAASAQFRFAAQGDGWCTAEPAARIQAGLDADFVRGFMARFDRLVAQRDGWAAALYLAPHWRGSARITEQGRTDRSVIDRNQFVAALQVADQLLQDDRQQREIVAIAIDPDGRSATVESRETETFRRDGVRIRAVGSAVDVLARVGDHVQLTESREETTNQLDLPR